MPNNFFALALAAVIGVAASTAGILFIDTAAALSGWQLDGNPAILLFPALAGLILALITRRLPGGFIGLADMVLSAQRGGGQPLRHHLYSAAAAFIALVGGASVGQYGPVAHLGGALGQLFRPLPRRNAIACGIAAAIAAAFNAPFTALVFVHEVVLRHYSLRAFTPVAISAVVGYSVSVGWFNRPLFLDLPQMASIHPGLVILFIIMGILFGLLAYLYLRSIFFIATKSRSIPLIWRLPAAGLLTGLLAFYLPEIAGGGKTLLQQSVTHLALITVVLLFAAKLIATVSCLGSGFAGGIVSPTLAIGGLAGLLFFHFSAMLFPVLPAMLPAGVIAMCGMMALTAPVLGAPLTGILLTMELSGSYPVAIAAAVAIAVSVQTAARLGGKSYYDMQLEQRGINVRLRPDEWHLATDTIASLMKPVQGNAVMLPPHTALTDAVEQAVERQCGNIFIADKDGHYSGHLHLPSAIKQMQSAPSCSLAEALSAGDSGPSPTLLAGDSLLNAMHKLENFVGDYAAVINDDGSLVGIISEGDILRRYNQLVHEYRREETAVS